MRLYEKFDRLEARFVSRRKTFSKIAIAGVIPLVAGMLLMLSPLATYTWQPLGILSLVLSVGGVGFMIPLFVMAIAGYLDERMFDIYVFTEKNEVHFLDQENFDNFKIAWSYGMLSGEKTCELHYDLGKFFASFDVGEICAISVYDRKKKQFCCTYDNYPHRMVIMK